MQLPQRRADDKGRDEKGQKIGDGHGVSIILDETLTDAEIAKRIADSFASV